MMFIDDLIQLCLDIVEYVNQPDKYDYITNDVNNYKSKEDFEAFMNYKKSKKPMENQFKVKQYILSREKYILNQLQKSLFDSNDIEKKIDDKVSVLNKEIKNLFN